jgi:hypothetical protein
MVARAEAFLRESGYDPESADHHHHMVKVVSNTFEAPRRVQEWITDFIRAAYGGDPVQDRLPSEHAYWAERWYDWDFNGAADTVFEALSVLATTLAPRFAHLPLFWAVLGPVYDALFADHSEGFAHGIMRSRTLLVDLLIKENAADAYDYWLLLQRVSDDGDDDGREDATDQLLGYLTSASSEDVEAFFTALDLKSVTNLAAERSWPNIEQFWKDDQATRLQ